MTDAHITDFMSIALHLRVLHTLTALLPTLNVIARLITVERSIALRLRVSHTRTLRTHIWGAFHVQERRSRPSYRPAQHYRSERGHPVDLGRGAGRGSHH